MSFGDLKKFDKTISFDDAVSSRRARQRRNAMANIFDGVDLNTVQNVLWKHDAGREGVEPNEDGDKDDDSDENDDFMECDTDLSVLINEDLNNNDIAINVPVLPLAPTDFEMNDVDKHVAELNRSNNARNITPESRLDDPVMEDSFFQSPMTLQDNTRKIPTRGGILFGDGYGFLDIDSDGVGDICLLDFCQLDDFTVDGICQDSRLNSADCDCVHFTPYLRCRRHAMADILDSLTESEVSHLHQMFDIKSRQSLVHHSVSSTDDVDELYSP